jgi:protein involved in polysaccharide export with SLBB domain
MTASSKYVGLMALLAATCIGAGCASRGNSDLTRLLEDMQNHKTASSVVVNGSHGPDSPSRRLPPPPSQNGVGRHASAAGGNGVSPKLGSITIQPDCLLQIKVEEDEGLNGSYPVNEIGAVEFGYVGPVILYNMTEEEAESKIREVLETRYFHNATVDVRILRASYDRVRISGAVNTPGLIRIGAGDAISLNDALLRAGGLRPAARGAKVKIVREGLLSAVALAADGEEYPLLAGNGKPSVPDVMLKNNDAVYVYSSEAGAPAELGEKEIMVLGEVKKRGVYRFSGSEACTMMHLLFKMGELPPYANRKAVQIFRRDEYGEETVIKVDAEKILEDGNPEEDIELENGDRVVVPARRIHLF